MRAGEKEIDMDSLYAKSRRVFQNVHDAKAMRSFRMKGHIKRPLRRERKESARATKFLILIEKEVMYFVSISQ